MRLHRFLVQADLRQKVLRVDDSELVGQWRNVLRLKDGAEVLLFDGSGLEARAEILKLGSDSAELRILEAFQNGNEPERHVVLCCSLLKRENFELVVQKATEVGVKEIIPILAKRTEKLSLRMDRLKRIAKEAAEQSGRGIMPKIREPMTMADIIEKSQENFDNLFFDITGDDAARKAFVVRDEPLAVWIGPEGGWTAEEVALAERAGFRKISLGPLTLRAETAAIVASYLAARQIE